MELGEKLYQARVAAGLSQRQLCGEEITRNMLSQIEHGTAHPSMSTLRYLAGRLELPVSYFLEEEGTVSSNFGCMQTAWSKFETGQIQEALDALEAFRLPDKLCEREYSLLLSLVLLRLAELRIQQERLPHARQLLARAEKIEEKHPWFLELKYRRILLQSRLEPVPEEMLPDVDVVLRLRSERALKAQKPEDAVRILEAAQNREAPEWNLLRGRTAFVMKEYGTAAKYLQNAEASDPAQTIPLLEICFREMGDFKTAYYYACKARER